MTPSFEPIRWTIGDWGQLLVEVRQRKLDAGVGPSWRWDPRPRVPGVGAPTFAPAGTANEPCPFLAEAHPLYEARAEWATGGAPVRLLVIGDAPGRLRWAWSQATAQERESP